ARAENDRRIKAAGEENDKQRAETLVRTLLAVQPGAVPGFIESLVPLRELALPILRKRFEEQLAPKSLRLRAACALIALGYDGEFSQQVFPAFGDSTSNRDVALDFVIDQVGEAQPEDYRNIATTLRRTEDKAKERLIARFRGAADFKRLKKQCRL